jgi:hypothetical protein
MKLQKGRHMEIIAAGGSTKKETASMKPFHDSDSFPRVITKVTLIIDNDHGQHPRSGISTITAPGCTQAWVQNIERLMLW